MSWPAAEVEIDESLVSSLLEEQHRDLAERPLVHLDTGFDNVLWRLGDDLLIRMPRRAVASTLIANEQRWLPHLAPRLPLPVPAPARLGRPSPLFPWPWSIVPWLAGVPADREPVTNAVDAATRLGAFLGALHHDAPSSAPHNDWRGVPLAVRAVTFEERMVDLGDHIEAVLVRPVWEAALAAAPFSGRPRWVHGDLHPGNILVADGTVVAIIDFGDMCAGDPATDVAAVWMALPSEGVDAFWEAYGSPDRSLVSRSLGWTVLFGLMLLQIGLRDHPTYERVARLALERAAAARID